MLHLSKTHPTHRPSRRRLAPLLLALLSSCSGWQVSKEYDGWTLYEMPDAPVEEAAYEAAFSPAIAAVEANVGPFARSVAVHAWEGSVRIVDDRRRHVLEAEDSGVHEIPGIGPARILAYHARGGAFASSGVFIGSPSVGTAVHELVHARLAETDADIPLWFEEGVASLLADGILHQGEWVIDGLACWPLRELREENLSAAEIARLISIQATDGTSVRDNVLVHFLGWAVVFDLYRETGSVDWRQWLEQFDGKDPIDEVRRRLSRTLRFSTEETWLSRLDDPDAGVRLAAAKGLWKLRSPAVLDRLIEVLEREADDEVRAGLAINALACAGEISITWQRWRTLRETVTRRLAGVSLDNPREQVALEHLLASYSRREDEQQTLDALGELARFWQE